MKELMRKLKLQQVHIHIKVQNQLLKKQWSIEN